MKTSYDGYHQALQRLTSGSWLRTAARTVAYRAPGGPSCSARSRA